MYKASTRILSGANFRHGVVLPPQKVQTSPSDMEGIVNIGVPQNSAEPWKSASGGIGWDEESATLAAVGEALERYAAASFQIPLRNYDEIKKLPHLKLEDFALFSKTQLNDPDFPYAEAYGSARNYTNVYSLLNNKELWAPAGLVALTSEYDVGLSTSSGLAAGQSKFKAILRGLQEIIERDALMVTWLHSIPARQIPTPEKYNRLVAPKGGSITCIDATPAYSPFPVAIVTGESPVRGHTRISLGAACRETWEAALDKAFLEWSQGVIFAGYYYSNDPSLSFKSAEDVKTFDDHAVYYTVHPDRWRDIPLLKGSVHEAPKYSVKKKTAANLLKSAVAYMNKHGVRLFYRDMTTIDLLQIGMHSVRVLSPHLTPIYCNQKFPFLGGRTKDVYWRYPWARKYRLDFPNPNPHPLG